MNAIITLEKHNDVSFKYLNLFLRIRLTTTRAGIVFLKSSLNIYGIMQIQTEQKTETKETGIVRQQFCW